MELTEKEVHDQIVRVIELYSRYLEREKGLRYMGWNPANPQASCKSWNHFARAAEAIRRMGANAEHYMEVQFLYLGVPVPQQLYGEAAGHRYQKARFFESRRYQNGEATRQPTIEAQFTPVFTQSARMLKAYLRLGIPKHEFYQVSGLKISPYFILADPDEATRMLEREPPPETWLRQAWWKLKENPNLRKRLTSLWRHIWTCEQLKPSPGARPTPSTP